MKPTLPFLLLLGLVALGGALAWWFLHGETRLPERPPAESSAERAAEPPTDAIPDPARAEAAAPIAERDSEWERDVSNLSRIPVFDITGKTTKTIETHPFAGRVVDATTGDPVYYFWIYLIPVDRGDVRVAANGWTPSRFRNGSFNLESQPAGIYNLLCESREHKPLVKEGISIPYEGELTLRLPHGSCIRGLVRDAFGTPLEGIDLQLIDPIEVDPGEKPPMQRITKSDAGGNYAFWKLPPGRYRVAAAILGDVLITEEQFRLDVDGEVRRDFTLDRLGTLKLTITNEVTQPVSRARVILFETRDGKERALRTTYSDLKGIARVDFVRDGTYKLRVQLPGFEIHDEAVTVVASQGMRELPVQLSVVRRPGR